MALETGRRQRRAAIIGERTPDGTTVTPENLRFGIGASLHGPCQGAHPTDMVFEDLLGMTVGLREGLGRFVQVVKVPQVVGPLREGLGDRRADGQRPIGHDSRHGHVQCLLDLAAQRGSVGGGGGQEATRQEPRARETSAEDPQDFLAAIGLEAIEGQANTPLRRRQAP